MTQDVPESFHGRLRFLDSGRGLAVMYVTVFHTAFMLNNPFPPELYSFLRFGETGVILFFVISGFSLCHTMPNHSDQRYPTLSYAFARIFRIAPLYYVLLVLTVAREAVLRPETTYSASQIFLSVTFLFNLAPPWHPGIVWASWTLGVEMIFYAIFPLIYFRCDTIWKKATLAVVLIGISLLLEAWIPSWDLDELSKQQYTYMNVVHAIPIFLIGMIAFDIFHRVRPQAKPVGVVLIAAGLSGLTFMASIDNFSHAGLKDYATALSYAALLMGLCWYPWTVLTNRITDLYAKICYSAYLWHPFIIYALYFSGTYSAIYALQGGVWVSFLTSMVVTFAVVTAVATLSFRFIEVPGQKLGKRLLASIGAKSNQLQKPAV